MARVVEEEKWEKSGEGWGDIYKGGGVGGDIMGMGPIYMGSGLDWLKR